MQLLIDWRLLRLVRQCNDLRAGKRQPDQFFRGVNKGDKMHSNETFYGWAQTTLERAGKTGNPAGTRRNGETTGPQDSGTPDARAYPVLRLSGACFRREPNWKIAPIHDNLNGS